MGYGVKASSTTRRARRTAAGRPATAHQYAEQYGLDVSEWPTPDEILRPTYRTYVEASPSALAREVCQAARPEHPLRRFPRVGDRFLHFDLVSELGRGTFGRVFAARQADLAGRLVALKVAPNLGGESLKLARLQHTNIVPIHSVHTVESLNAICMPYFGATTLADVIRDLSGKTNHLPETGRELLGTLFDSRLAPSGGTGEPGRTGPGTSPRSQAGPTGPRARTSASAIAEARPDRYIVSYRASR